MNSRNHKSDPWFELRLYLQLRERARAKGGLYIEGEETYLDLEAMLTFYRTRNSCLDREATSIPSSSNPDIALPRLSQAKTP